MNTTHISDKCYTMEKTITHVHNHLFEIKLYFSDLVRKYLPVRSSEELEYTDMRRSVDIALVPPTFLLKIPYLSFKKKTRRKYYIKIAKLSRKK